MFDYRIKHFKELDSTNSAAHHYAVNGGAEGMVILADFQSEGRGKPGRKWQSPPGKNLLFSVLLRPPIPAGQAVILTQIACRSVAAVLENLFRLRCEFKKPNDLIFNGKKICGVLVESRSSGRSLNFVVVGIGLNVNVTGPELYPGSTSVAENTGTEPNLKVLLHSILEKLKEDLRPFYAKPSPFTPGSSSSNGNIPCGNTTV